MHIAYVTCLDVSTERGVTKKMVRHIECWRAAGHKVSVFSFSKSERVWSGFGETPVVIEKCKGLLSRLWRARRFFRRVAEIEPDLIYYRSTPWYPGIVRLSRLFPLIREVNTFDLGELRLKQPFLFYLFHRLTREVLYRRTSGFVFLTSETRKHFTRFNRPAVVIGDSIDLKAFSVCDNQTDSVTRLLLVSQSPAPWIGIDKVMQMAGMFPSWRFEIVGFTAADLEERNVPKNVVFHGFLCRKEYERIICRCDLGIGTLALHRIGMNESTPLKVREYLAFGLPVIIGYEDTDMKGTWPFVLKLPNEESSVKMSGDAIRAFVDHWKGKRVQHSEIIHLDMRQKEQTRMRFFEGIKSDWENRDESSAKAVGNLRL